MSSDPARKTKGTRALRRGRYSARGYVYHVTAATLNRRPIFSDFTSGRLVVGALRDESHKGNCETLCFVVMPDHLHWLLRLTGSVSLSVCVNNVKSRSAREINRARGHRGALWQKGFYDHAMRGDEDLRATARYIAANPLRAGLVQRVGDYPLWDAVWDVTG